MSTYESFGLWCTKCHEPIVNCKNEKLHRDAYWIRMMHGMSEEEKEEERNR